MTFLLRAVAALAILTLSGSFGASLPLEKIPHIASAQNLELAAARLRLDEARARVKQAGRLANPEAGWELRPNVRGREFSTELTFEQRFPLTSRLRLEKEVSALELAKAEAEVADVERQIIAAAREAAVNWLGLKEKQALHEAQLANAQKFAASVAKRAAAGEAAPLEAEQAKFDAAHSAFQIKHVQSERTLLEGELRILLGIKPGEKLEISGALAPPTPTKPSPGALTNRPDYRAARLAEDQARKEIDLEKSRRWEDARLGGVVEFKRQDDAGYGIENETMIGLQFSLPLPLWNKNEAKIEEAEARSLRVQKETEALAAKILTESQSAADEMVLHAELAAESSATLLKLAEEQVKQTQAAYQNGEAKLNEVLKATDQLLSIKLARLDAVRDWHLAKIRFEATSGANFPQD